MARARARARSAVTAVNALSVGLSLLIRASASSVTASALVLPDAITAAISAAVAHDVSTAMASGLEDRRGLGLVRQFEFRHHGSVLQDDVQISLHRRSPIRLERNYKRARCGR